MPLSRPLPLLLLVGLVLAGVPRPPAAAPASDAATPVWIALLPPGQGPEDALALGARVRDAFPDALLLAEARSARLLAGAGYAVEGPLRLEAGRTTFLLHARRGDTDAAALAAARLGRRPSVRLLWHRGADLLVQAAGRSSLGRLPRAVEPKVLAASPLQAPTAELVASSPRPRGSTPFGPLVDEIAARVDSAAYFRWIGDLAGARSVPVGGVPVTFSTRYTTSAQCDSAEQYVYERFVAMGFPLVEYDPFPVGGGTGRNVIATLPGTVTPERIYIVCGHLDSTSPTPLTRAPGANDNASGTAAVLTAAEILSDYGFESTLRFIAFTGEEQGLVGSDHYAAAAAARGDSILGVLNCDMIAWHGANYAIDLESRIWASDLVQVVDDACARYTSLSTTIYYFPWGSDHVPFLQRGFPALLAIESDYAYYPCYHDPCDTTGNNSGSFGAEVARACIAALAHLAGVVAPTSAPSPAAALAPELLVSPNPSRASALVRYRLRESGPVDLAVYDVTGRRVRVLAEGLRGAGWHEAVWDGRSESGLPAPGGVYFYRLVAGGRTVTGKGLRLR